VDSRRAKRLHEVRLEDLPNGTMVAEAGQAWLVLDGGLLPWSPSGYGSRRAEDGQKSVMALTPPSIIGIIRAGYQPGMHSTAWDR
jgi:hypothetical protein